MSNAMDARTLGSIALGQIHNGAGTCKFFSLHTGKVFTANHFTVLPMTDLVVEHLNKMARKDLKPTTREPIFRLHDTDISDSPPFVKLDDFSPKELTQGPPITVTVDETDEDNSPIELTHAVPEVLDSLRQQPRDSSNLVRYQSEFAAWKPFGKTYLGASVQPASSPSLKSRYSILVAPLSASLGSY